MNVKKIFKKFFLGLIAIVFLFLAFLNRDTMDTTQVLATGSPRFNFMQGDAEMLRGAKRSDNVWTDPVSADPGDDIAVLSYFHNGMDNTIATNTRLRVDLPSGFAKSHHLKSYLWSDQTAPITATVVNGQIVGREGLAINLSEIGALEYVPGSTKIFRGGAQTGTPMPDGIMTQTGLNIGDTRGCWEFAGYVTFILRIKTGVTDIRIEKRVAKTGSSDWQTEISAEAGQEVAYRIGLRNDGNTVANDVLVKDILPTYVSYVAGSTYLYSKDKPEGQKLDDKLTTSGITLSELKPGYDGIIYIVYKARLANDIPNNICGMALINIARVYFCGSQKGHAEAKITLKCPAPEEKKLEIDKLVKNKEGNFVKESVANLNDILEYRIAVKNVGNVKIDDIRVFDVLPEYVHYLPGSTTLNGQTVSDQIITSNGLNIGSLEKSQSAVITLKVKIVGCPPTGDYVLVNTAKAVAPSVLGVHSNARTIVGVTPVVEPKSN